MQSTSSWLKSLVALDITGKYCHRYTSMVWFWLSDWYEDSY